MRTPSLSVTSLTSSSHASPQIESCCYRADVSGYITRTFAARLTATSILSLPTSSMLRMTFFSIFTSCESFLARSGPKAPAADLRKACPERSVMSVRARKQMIFNALASVECLGSDKVRHGHDCLRGLSLGGREARYSSKVAACSSPQVVELTQGLGLVK